MSAECSGFPDIGSIDLADPRTYVEQDLADYWRTLRADHPVYWHAPTPEHSGFWVVSRYTDVAAILRDSRTFSVERGNALVTLLRGGDSAAGQMLPVTDGKRHRDLRNVMLKAFSPRAMSRVAEKVRARTRKLVARAALRGESDFVEEVAAQVPSATIADLLGVPEQGRADLLGWSSSSLSSEQADQAPKDAWLARARILQYFSDLVAEKRKRPTDDVISSLAQTEPHGEPLSDTDLAYNCYSLVIGGDENSRLAIAGLVLALARNPDQWRSLREHRVSLDSATEEVLRWATPAMHFGRLACADVDVAGQRIRAGDVVTLWSVSANRDESVFADPYLFDLARAPNKHLAFGYGPHFCLGAYLGRIEIREVLDALRTYCAGIELAGDPRPVYSNLMCGVSYLPVRLHRDQAAFDQPTVPTARH
jgi:cytochrome P450